MPAALVIKIVLPLSLLALFGALYAAFRADPGPPHLNARQQQMIESLKTMNVRDKGAR